MLQKELRKLILSCLLPGLILYAVIWMWPNISAIYWSFTNYTGIGPTQTFIGLENFRQLINDHRWWDSVWTTFYITIGAVITILPASLLFAILLKNLKFGQGFFKFTVFIPSILPVVIVALLFVFILDPTIGLLDYLLKTLGLTKSLQDLLGVMYLNWLGDPSLVKPSIIMINFWQGLGFYVILFLAGLSKIPPELFDAAKIDGANGWALFRNVTWPLLYPTTQTIFLLLIINSLQIFTLIYVLSGSNPSSLNQVMATYVYREAFKSNAFGYASALSLIMVIIIFTISLSLREISNRETIQF